MYICIYVYIKTYISLSMHICTKDLRVCAQMSLVQIPKIWKVTGSHTRNDDTHKYCAYTSAPMHLCLSCTFSRTHSLFHKHAKNNGVTHCSDFALCHSLTNEQESWGNPDKNAPDDWAKQDECVIQSPPGGWAATKFSRRWTLTKCPSLLVTFNKLATN